MSRTSSGAPDVPCLAACEDQLNLVTETSSAFPNTETFHRREEFCLIAKKLIRTCGTKKAAALSDHFPQLCKHLAEIETPEKARNLPFRGFNLFAINLST